MKSSWRPVGLFLFSAVLAFPQGVAAQSESRNVEVGGFAGITSSLPSSSTKWNYGGGFGTGLTRNLSLTAEVARTRLYSSSSTLFEVKSHILEATAGVQYLVPFAVHAKVSPFVGAAVGLVRVGVSAKSSTFDDEVASSSDMTVNFGAGARLFVSRQFGLKPEVKIVHIPGNSYLRSQIGLFYRF